jgi:hypothetical protein
MGDGCSSRFDEIGGRIRVKATRFDSIGAELMRPAAKGISRWKNKDACADAQASLTVL